MEVPPNLQKGVLEPGKGKDIGDARGEGVGETDATKKFGEDRL